jgi:hypothetical protein
VRNAHQISGLVLWVQCHVTPLYPFGTILKGFSAFPSIANGSYFPGKAPANGAPCASYSDLEHSPSEWIRVKYADGQG